MIALAASLAPRRYALASSMAELAILALGLAGSWELAAGPQDLWLRYPCMVTWLHPYILGLDCVLAPVIVRNHTLEATFHRWKKGSLENPAR